MSKRGLFGITDFHAAKPEKSSFARGVGNGLADMLEPAFEGSCVRRGLRTDNGGRLLEDFKGYGHDFGGLLAGELRAQPVACSRPSLGRLELGCKSEGEPGPRGPAEMNMYACYIRDYDGNKIMVCRTGD